MTWIIGAAGVFMLAAIAAWALRSSWRQGRGLLARPEAESWQDRIDSLHARGYIDAAEADVMRQQTRRTSCAYCGRLEGHRPGCPQSGRRVIARDGGDVEIRYGTGDVKPW